VAEYRGVQVNVGEVIAWRNLFWGLSDGMVNNVLPWNKDYVLPNMDTVMAYRMVMTVAYPRVKEIIEQVVASGLIYQPSGVRDFGNPELRPYLDKYVRGSNGQSAEERIKLMKLLWDAVGSEFGGRHELYERNYAGSHETIRFEPLYAAQASGATERMKALVDQCMAEYDLDGWLAPDMVSPNDVNFFSNGFHHNGNGNGS
jgi:4-hydroxyphenylacetate 3-monooxygenase